MPGQLLGKKQSNTRFSIGAKRADAKGRVTLGADAIGKEFDVVRNDAGQFILTPKVRIPEREAWLYNNPEALGIFQAGLAEAAAGRVSELEDYSQYAEIDIGD